MTWLGLAFLILAGWLFTGFLIVTGWHLTRQAAQRRRYQQAVRQVGEDTLDTLIRATRENPPRSHAWGPGTDQPVPYWPARAATRRGRCGCLYKPCSAHAAIGDMERLARQQMEDR